MDRHFLDLVGLSKYMQEMKQYVQTEVNKRVPTSRTINGKALSSNVTLSASDVSALPITGGTLTGDLKIKGSSNYGNKLSLGDGDYVHISEPTDDCMEVKAKKVNFVLSDSTDSKFTINGSSPFATSGGGSGSVEVISWKGTGSSTDNTLHYAHSGAPINVIITGNYGDTYSRYEMKYMQFTFNGSTQLAASYINLIRSSISAETCTVTLDTSNKSITANYSTLTTSDMDFTAVLFFA